MEIEKFLAQPEETRRRQIKRLIYETVPDGEVKETAAALGIEAYTLYKARDENRENYDLLHPRLLALMHRRRDLRILYWLNDLFGLLAFPAPCGEICLKEVNRQVAAVLGEVSGAVQALMGALKAESAQGEQITSGEMAEIEAAIGEAQRDLSTLREVARQLTSLPPRLSPHNPLGPKA